MKASKQLKHTYNIGVVAGYVQVLQRGETEGEDEG